MQLLRQEATEPEYVDAFKSLRAARCLFGFLVLVPLLVFLAAFVLVEWTTVLDDQPVVVAKAGGAAQEAATKPSATTTPASTTGATIKSIITDFKILPAMRFLALAAAILLALTFLLATKVSLIGQLGGVSSFISAFFWTLLLLVFLTPWDQVFPACWAASALFNVGLDQIKAFKTDWIAQHGETIGQIYYYGRFLAYPLIALLVWMIVLVKFGRGYGRVKFPTAVSRRPDEP